jgi:hypothetical protein
VASRLFPPDRLFLIAGPCVIESDRINLKVADVLVRLAEKVPGGIVFKASFDKANRSNAGAPRGPGMAEGLEALARIREKALQQGLVTPDPAARTEAFGGPPTGESFTRFHARPVPNDLEGRARLWRGRMKQLNLLEIETRWGYKTFELYQGDITALTEAVHLYQLRSSSGIVAQGKLNVVR